MESRFSFFFHFEIQAQLLIDCSIDNNPNMSLFTVSHCGGYIVLLLEIGGWGGVFWKGSDGLVGGRRVAP